jgi:hypothetical protein
VFAGTGSPAVAGAISGNFSLALGLNPVFFPGATSISFTVSSVCRQGEDFPALPTIVKGVSSSGAIPVADIGRAKNTLVQVSAPTGATLKSVFIQTNPVGRECQGYVPVVMLTGSITVQSGPGPSPSPSPTPLPAQFAFSLSVKSATGRPNVELDQGIPTLAMKPTVFGCGQIPFYSDERTFVLKCINKVTGQSVDGCRFATNLKSGPKHGGHEHDYDSRPLGQAYIDETLPIPAGGLEFTYLPPEISGDVDFGITGTGPRGETVSPAFLRLDLRAGDFKPIDVPFLTFDVKSHPQGTYGTEKLSDKLKIAIMNFRAEVADAGIGPIPVIESESASLPFGGLFDIHYATDSPWTAPHCSHRDGRRIDISLSVFDAFPAPTRQKLALVLEQAMMDAGLSPVREGDHWHVSN